jgi:putative ABC transport system substrate-binding protein
MRSLPPGVESRGVLASPRGQGVRVSSAFAPIAGLPDTDYSAVTAKYALVSVPSTQHEVADGALLGYWQLDDDVQERKAVQLARILRGTPAGDIPFETPTRYRLSLNRKAAAILGVTIPPEVLVAADEVYD